MSNTAAMLAGPRPTGRFSGSATRQRGRRKLHKSFRAGQSFWPALLGKGPSGPPTDCYCLQVANLITTKSLPPVTVERSWHKF